LRVIGPCRLFGGFVRSLSAKRLCFDESSVKRVLGIGMLKRVTIQHYRGFYSKQTFNFAIPDGSKPGSGLTLIVGPNNSGKTTFIEALTFTKHDGNSHRFLGIERHGRRAPIITLTDTARKTEKITNVNGGAQVDFEGHRLDELQLEIIGSRRYWTAQYSGNMNFGQFNTQSAKQARNAGDPGTAALLAEVNKDATQRDALTGLMKRLVPDFSSWTVNSREPGGDYLRYETGRGNFHAVDMLGDGIVSLFRICLHLVNNQADDYTLIIDEPELSLHPNAQKTLRKILSETTAKKQIIVVTHSPHFVDWDDINNGAKVLRLNKHEDNQSVVNELNLAATYMTALGSSVEQWQKPELLDVLAKEILFANKVLFESPWVSFLGFVLGSGRSQE